MVWLQFIKITREEALANAGGLGADLAEAAPAEFVAGGVVHRPVVGGGVGSGDGEEGAQIV